jgi:hypothetical protein
MWKHGAMNDGMEELMGKTFATRVILGMVSQWVYDIGIHDD